MTDSEIEIFIEEMEHVGDDWVKEDVKRCYGNTSLEEALNIRKSELNIFFSAVGAAINGGII